jgi:hypothetical protein
VVVCAHAIPSAATGLLTYVEVQEEWTFPKESFGQNMGVQAIFSVLGDGDYEVRLAWNLANGRTAAPAGDAIDRLKVEKKARFMAPVLRLPPEPGLYWLTLEWRPVGTSTWQTSEARCPIDVRLREEKPAAKSAI